MILSKYFQDVSKLIKKEVIYILYYFTYKDYIHCIHNIKQKDYLSLNEEIENYNISPNNYLETPYTDILEYLFKDRKRICTFINCFQGNHKIIPEESLEFIEYVKEKKTIKIIYRNGNNIYLIIYQKEIHLNLPYRILRECIKIMQKYHKSILKHTIIIPIVMYFKDKNVYYAKPMHSYFKITTYDNHILKLKYNLINVSKFADRKEIKNTILEELIYIENLE